MAIKLQLSEDRKKMHVWTSEKWELEKEYKRLRKQAGWDLVVDRKVINTRGERYPLRVVLERSQEPA